MACPLGRVEVVSVSPLFSLMQGVQYDWPAVDELQSHYSIFFARLNIPMKKTNDVLTCVVYSLFGAFFGGSKFNMLTTLLSCWPWHYWKRSSFACSAWELGLLYPHVQARVC